MSKFKIGLASVTFRQKTTREIVDICKQAEVNYIEWGGDVHVKTLEDAHGVKTLCDENGITICSYGSYFNPLTYDEVQWTDICKIAESMGAGSIRIWLGKKDSEDTSEEEYQLLVENTKKMCDIASRHSLLVCPECHDNTFNNNTDAILRFINDLSRDNFKTYFQSRYFRMEYDLDRIDRTYDYIENVHVSYRDLKREQRFREKNPKYIDTLLEKFISKGFESTVLVEFTQGDSEKNFYDDVKKLKEILK